MALSKIRNDSLADTAVHGRRNLVINGAMQVWQRGTSKTGLTSGENYLVDRFRWKIANNGTWRIDQSTDTPNDSFKYSYKAECTTADTSVGSVDQLRLITSLEGQDLVHLAYGSSAAKKTTLSFWIKSNKAATYAITLEAGGGRNYTVHYTVDTANTWEHKTITINGDTTNVLGNQGNTAGIIFSWWFGVGTAYDSDETQDAWYSDGDYSGLTGGVTTNLADTVGNNVYITGVQLEVGDTATPFEHRSFGEELALCRRYYTKSGNIGTSTEWFAGVTTYAGYYNRTAPCFKATTDRAWVFENFPVTMRAAPTVTYYPGRSGVTNTAGSITQYNTNVSVTTTYKPSSGTNGLNGYFQSTSSDNASGYTYQYTADAEL